MSEVAIVLPFTIDGSGNVRTTTDQSLIWSNRVRIALGTVYAERVMRPEYGSKAPTGFMNTGSSMAELISKETARVFNEQLPLLTLDSVNTRLDERNDQLIADVVYTLPNNVQSTTQVGVMVVSSTNAPYEELS